jgi:flagellar basal-body rod protein FlgB
LSLLDTTQLALEAAMRGSMERQTLLTNNLANVDTPGYQREDVNFQSSLRNAMQSGDETGLSTMGFQPVTETAATRADGNGVNAEQESAQLSENALLYQTLTQVAASREGILLSAMGTRA